jgi:hypothetical protein
MNTLYKTIKLAINKNPKLEDLESGLKFISNWPVYLKDCRLRAIFT